MAYTLDHYPGGLPEFISANPAPREWQRRVQAIDPDLWIAWNPHYQEGARWSIVRWVGKNGFGRGSIPLVGEVRRPGVAEATPFTKAMFGGWSFVRTLNNPDGSAAQLVSDMAVLDLFRDDYWRKYGREKSGAAEKIEKEIDDLRVGRDVAHKKLMDEAWKDTLADKAITNNATSVVIP